MTESIYDKIGRDYSRHRKADSRIVDILYRLLELPAGSVVADIGAGTGNYSVALADKEYFVKAVEPSNVMKTQRLEHEKVEWFTGSAENIPLASASVDGVMVVLALHHFASVTDAAREFHRICPSGPVVVFTFDPRESAKFWFADYFPEIWRQAYDKVPDIDTVAQTLAKGNGWSTVKVKFPLPRDLSDRFMAAGWHAPEMYLTSSVRQGMSGFALADPDDVRRGLERLRDDLTSGRWDQTNGHLRTQLEFDAGYRFLKFASSRRLGE